MTTLYVMVGVSGSGKSTIAQELVNKSHEEPKPIIVSSDSIREELFGDVNDQEHNSEVFSEVHKRIKANIKTRSVIVDATNITVKSRRAILNCVPKNCDIRVVAMVMTTSIGNCKALNAKRDRVVPDYVIDRQVGKFEIPFYEEGFNEITLVALDGSMISITSENERINAEKAANFISGADKKCDFWDTDDDIIMDAMKGFDQKTHHHKYLLDEHCRRCAAEVAKRDPDDIVIYRAAQIHDIGKLCTGKLKDDDSDDYCYYSHHNIGTYLLMGHMEKIGFWEYDNLLKVLFYVNYHMLPFFINTPKARAKWEKLMGKENLNKLFLFNECDKIASGN